MKYFIITIDTEEDNQWDSIANNTTDNSRYIPRFQKLSEKYGFKPTWLTTYGMASDEFYKEYIRDCLKRETCEVGMHLHAWNNPPEYPIKRTTDQRAYLYEYPEMVMEEKVKELRNKLEQEFEVKITSHRSGRWATNNTYFQILKKNGIEVDCSVTPYINWSDKLGATGIGGTDYTGCPEHAFYIYDDILEVPVSIRPLRVISWDGIHTFKEALRELKNSLKTKNTWVRPMKNLSFHTIKKTIDRIEKDSDYVMFMIHSPELMPGGSPSFPDENSIERLYDCIEKIFVHAKQNGSEGCTLSNYMKIKKEQKKNEN